MFAYLKGKLAYCTPAMVHLDVAGVGYEVHISLNTYSAIQQMNEARLWVHLQIKEDAHTLFGFYEEIEKQLFLQLLSVSGVGASTARMMLSSMTPAELAQAIAHGNEKLLEKIKGIGAKTAKRIILELKDKVTRAQPVLATDMPAVHINNNNQQDALNALVALGIAKPAAEQALTKVLKAMPQLEESVEDLLKHALKNL